MQHAVKDSVNIIEMHVAFFMKVCAFYTWNLYRLTYSVSRSMGDFEIIYLPEFNW